MAGYDHPSTAIGYRRALRSGLKSADIDVERARRDTPGTANVAHLHNAGVAPPPRQDTDAVIAQLHREAAIGGYEGRIRRRPTGRAHLPRRCPAPCLYSDLDLGVVVMTHSTDGLDRYSLFELLRGLDWATALSSEGVRACRSEK